MLINELPDDCLFSIFDHLNNLNDLINCFKVCAKWSYLVTQRTRKVKYLLEGDPIDSFDCVHYNKEQTIDGIVLNTLFKNLEILNFCLYDNSNFDDFIFLVTINSLKGLICHGPVYACESIAKSIFKSKLEMLSFSCIDEIILQNCSSITQLRVAGHNHFRINALKLNDLQRLSIPNFEGCPDAYYDGPVMEKLKIVELCLASGERFSTHGFQFMDSCPNLHSAYIVLEFGSFFVFEPVEHRSLQDLVIEVSYNTQLDWHKFRSLLMKYPNLKHLRLKDDARNLRNIEDEDIKQLLAILPNLILLDVSSCPAVTQSSADYVQFYCERFGRSIKFYFQGNQKDIRKDFPQLSTEVEKISRGFDFMKHCFLKNFHELPIFMSF